jgi:hypothetical protein
MRAVWPKQRSKGSTEPDLLLACASSEVRAWGSGHDEFFDHTANIFEISDHQFKPR